jgi:hypothetical protein
MLLSYFLLLQPGVLFDQLGSTRSAWSVSTYGLPWSPTPIPSADDFVVPGGETWSLAALQLDAMHSTDCRTKESHAPAGVLRLYQDQAGLPGTLLVEESVSLFPHGPQMGLNLRAPLRLGPGHYWISLCVQSRYGCVWRWYTADAANNYQPFVQQMFGTWQSCQPSPGGGVVCDGDNTAAHHDLSFALLNAPLLEPVPTLKPLPLLLMTLLLLADALTLGRRKGRC